MQGEECEQREERQDLDQIRANLACTPAERLELLRQMDDFFLLARRARRLGPALAGKAGRSA